MYWFRDGSSLALLPWLAAFLAAWLGGWLLASHAFRLRKNERLVAGLALGLVLFAWLANLIGRWLAPGLTFYLAALLVLLAGILIAWRSPKRPWLSREDLGVWPMLIAGLGLVWLFLLWSKGLALFDEHKNLSLISIIANGNIPPRYVPYAPIYFAYHYGFQVFAASLMKLGGMLPWSAFDTAKSIAWGVTVLLAALLGRRVSGKSWGGWAAAAALVFASGTRYLLLVLPPSLLLQADKFVQLQGTSALIAKPFSEALLAGWPVDGGPPFPYPFAFLNGILQPFVMAHQGPNTFSLLILLLVWLLIPRQVGRGSVAILTAILAMWALVWETSYALFIIGAFGLAIIHYLRWRNLALPHLAETLWAAAASLLFALLQGGTFTEMARGLIGSSTAAASMLPAVVNLVSGLAGHPGFAAVANSQAAGDVLGFTLRWPPAILSSHLGALSLFSPIQLVVGLFELGPVILFTPWLTIWAWRRANAGEWVHAALGLAAWVGFLMPLVLQYEADRDISRLSSQALLIWTLMLVFVIADRSLHWKTWLRQAGMAALVVACFGGLVVAGIQFTAASTTKLGDNFDKLDAAISAQIWGQIPNGAKVFGPLGSTTILSGHLTGVLLDDLPQGSRWSELTQSPTLAGFVESDYDFVYIDSRGWDNLAPEVQAVAGFDTACVVTAAEVWDNSHVNYRRLLDLRACR